MQPVKAIAQLAQPTPIEVPPIRESALPLELVKQLGKADVANATEDLALSVALCSMAQRHLTREDLVREAAYLHAEARNFAPGGEVSDWFGAERKVDHWLGIYGLPRHFTFHGSAFISV
jgi:hypothetical protein